MSDGLYSYLIGGGALTLLLLWYILLRPRKGGKDAPPIVTSSPLVPIPIFGVMAEFFKSPNNMVKRCYKDIGSIFTIPVRFLQKLWRTKDNNDDNDDDDGHSQEGRPALAIINLTFSFFFSLFFLLLFKIFHKRLTFLIGPEAQELFFQASDDVLSQNEVYDFMQPVFGKGIVYDATKKNRQVQFQTMANGLRASRLKVRVYSNFF